MIPMRFESADITDLPNLVTNDEVVLEQKLDGARLLTVIENGPTDFHTRVDFRTHGGRPMRYAAAAQHFDTIRPELARLLGDTPGRIVLDGEIMPDTGTYHLFDVPEMRLGGVEWVRPSDPLHRRRERLETIAATLAPYARHVTVVAQAQTPRAKQLLIDQVTEIGGEGFMAKHRIGRYEPGKRVRHTLKVKFVHTADVVVTAFERPDVRHGSASLAVYHGDTLVPVGGCSLIGKPEVAVGDVIEVAFAHFRDAMIQPRMLRTRPDKTPAECTIGQFKTYSKAVV